MIGENILHILNGQEMYRYFKKTHFLKNSRMVPFNEAMCYGNITDDIFSKEFIKLRAMVHHVTARQYTDITLKPLEPLFSEKDLLLELWFDADMFCQMNVLTILALLDQTDYNKKIKLHIVDENFVPIDVYSINSKGFYDFYQQVFIQKKMPNNIYPIPLKRGIELYLHYLNEESDLMIYIKQHQHVYEEELVSVLIQKFKAYGLGDTQYREIIRIQRNSN